MEATGGQVTGLNLWHFGFARQYFEVTVVEQSISTPRELTGSENNLGSDTKRGIKLRDRLLSSHDPTLRLKMLLGSYAGQVRSRVQSVNFGRTDS
jgi:hypothetical protein